MKKSNKELIVSLDEEQKVELLLAFEENLNEDNLLTHEEVKTQHKRWLEYPLK